VCNNKLLLTNHAADAHALQTLAVFLKDLALIQVGNEDPEARKALAQPILDQLAASQTHQSKLRPVHVILNHFRTGIHAIADDTLRAKLSDEIRRSVCR
jgi:hypothetical protein